MVVLVAALAMISCAGNNNKKAAKCETATCCEQCDGACETKAECTEATMWCAKAECTKACDKACDKAECKKGECKKGDCHKGECHKGECKKAEGCKSECNKPAEGCQKSEGCQGGCQK